MNEADCDVEAYDTATELMHLYRALRSTPDVKIRAALKERIDFLVEQAHRAFPPQRIGMVEQRDGKLNS